MTTPDRIPADPLTTADPAPAKHEGDALLDPSGASAVDGADGAGAPAPESADAVDGPAVEAPTPAGPEPVGDDGAPPSSGAAGSEALGDDTAAPSAQEDRATEYLALAQRTQADFENFRKRAARDVRAAEGRGVARAARELLPALDHLTLALDNLEQGPALEGIRLVQRELLSALARLGIEAYSPKGEAFDPQVHEAVSQLAVEGVETGTVFEVMQHGYRHGEAVLRPARVVVAA